MISILIADDQTLIRTGIRKIVEAEDDLTVVGEAADGDQAVSLVAELVPDVVLMDIRMPHRDGLDATEAILRGGGTSRVLVLTTFDLDEYVYRALRVGASGFLLKTSPADELIGAIRNVAAGDAALAPSVTRRLIGEFVRNRPAAAPPATLGALTARELETLRLVARGLSNGEIAAQLYLTTATVKTHVANLLQKLAVRDRVQLVIIAYETGLAS